MKGLHVLFLLLVGGLIFLVAKPGQELNRQAEEETAPYEQMARDTFRIYMDIESENDRPVADILWFRKAARVALEQRSAWFNVLEQQIGQDAVDGVIQLEKDPMKAEYDAHEILSLHLGDETAD